MRRQEDSVLHVTHTLYRDAFRVMATMRHQNELCDVTLVTGSGSISAHKVVLAAVSPYFHAMFTSEMKEKRSSEVHLREVDNTGLECLVDYAYSSTISVTESNVQVLLPLACRLQIAPVRDACCVFLTSQLHPANCLGIRRFADAHACEELLKVAHEYAVSHFSEVCTSDEFVHLTASNLLELLANPELNITDELLMCRSVLKWVRHATEERAIHLPQLLSQVRMPLLPHDFLMDEVEADPLIYSACRDLLVKAMKYHLMPERRALWDSMHTHPRRPSSFQPYLFALGGGSLFAIHAECEVYDKTSDQWHVVSPMTSRRSRCGVVCSLGKLYVIGGYDGSQDLAHVECFNPSDNQWTRMPSMGSRRSCLGVCEWNGLIFAAGGFDGSSCLNTVERFDPLTSTWASIPAMSLRRKFVKLAMINNTVYAIGGYDGTTHMSNVEKFEIEQGQWVSGPSMISRRSNAGVAVLDDVIYVSGGTDGATCLSSVERLNPQRNIWEAVASMNTRRSTHEMVALGGQLLAVGGNDGSSSLNSVERYDKRTNRWMFVAAMNMRRSSLGAAVLDMARVHT